MEDTVLFLILIFSVLCLSFGTLIGVFLLLFTVSRRWTALFLSWNRDLQ